jgi:hypothetical protein
MRKKSKRSPNDLLLYIHEHHAVRSKDLERVFVDTHQMSRATMYKYKRVLEELGKLERRVVFDKPPYYTYAIPERLHAEMKLLQQYRILAKNTFLNIEEIPWENSPPGFYLTKVQHKVLWKDEVTEATMVIEQSAPGDPRTCPYSSLCQ